MEDDIIYLDHAAATPLVPEAATAMMDAYRDAPGNPSALGHSGRAAARLLEEARDRMAQALDFTPERLVFTSGGTESVGLAVLGTLLPRERGHVIASAIEHPAVLGSLQILQRRGFEVTLVPPDPGGVVDPERFAEAARPDTALACLMHVNNELGTVQPLELALGRVKERAPSCTTFVDAVQSLTRLPLEPERWGADLVALSAHKVGGPRGVGALVTGSRRPQRIFGGGDQEWGVRPGTENVPGVVGFVAALLAAEAHRTERASQVSEVCAAFEEELRRQVPGARINGNRDNCLPWILSISVAGISSEALVRGMDELGVLVSAGAACHARAQKQSHVLRAIGLSPRLGTIRVSFGAESTVDNARRAVQTLARTVKRYAIG